MKEPSPIGPTERLFVITETVSLTITVDRPCTTKFEVCRLAREPFYIIRPLGPEPMTAIQTGDPEEGFAEFEIVIGKDTVAA